MANYNPTTIRISVPLDANFKKACDHFGVDPQQSLQHFLDQFSVYEYLTRKKYDKDAAALSLFSGYVDSRPGMPTPDYLKRPTHIHFLRCMIQLIRSNGPWAEKEKASRELIDQWYDSLNK